jgi:hypothetical protein
MLLLLLHEQTEFFYLVRPMRRKIKKSTPNSAFSPLLFIDSRAD